jgi:DNA repair protein RadA/Sms
MGKLSQGSRGKRFTLGLGEFDRVLGGGVVPGEVVLVAGEPGIGKSTLLLQTAISIAGDRKVLYVSGEESLSQLASRVDRLTGSNPSRKGSSDVVFTDETVVETVISTIKEQDPDLVIVDSIQSLSTRDVASYPGSVTQVRESGGRLTECAKQLDIPILVVGQVTKEGAIAGPKVLEHVVDAVVHFEGDEMGLYRILRCVKNRFGTTDEVGIFEMTSEGLVEVEDPTNVLGSSGKVESGSAVSAVYKGSRTLFVEIQALTSPAMFGAPRRIPTGISKQRLEMLCAVLTRRAGVNLSEEDVFVNVSGGLKLDDPSADLAVCMAVASAKLDAPLDRADVFVGEVGLSGEIRTVPFMSKIVSEAKRRKLSITGRTGVRQKSIRSIVKPLFKKRR